jgi:hypothetical protein
LAQKPRIIRAKSWDGLPEVLEPGTYYTGNERIIVKQRVSR